MKNTSPQFTLRTILVIPFVIQILAAVGLVGYLSFRNGQNAINDLANQLIQKVSNGVVQHLLDYVQTPQLINRLNADALALGELDMQQLPAMERHLITQMMQFESISNIQVGNSQNDFRLVKRQDGLRLLQSNSANPTRAEEYALDAKGRKTRQISALQQARVRDRPWYQTALFAGKSTWGAISRLDNTGNLFLTATQPVYDLQGQVRGVFSSAISLDSINQFLNQLQVGKSDRVLIMERNGWIVAASDRAISKTNLQFQRFNLINSSNPIDRAAARSLIDRFGDYSRIDSSQQIVFSQQHKRYFLQVTPFRDEYGLDWLIVLTVPESDFMEQINANTRNTILLCVMALIVATILGIYTTRLVTNPLVRLIQASGQFASGNLDRRVYTTDIVEIDEIKTLGHSFNSMASQLKELFETLEDKVKERTAELASASDEINALNEKLKEDNLRMGTELDVARQIQQMILPKVEELEIEGLDIAAYMEPADEIGGDYYDVLHTDGVVTLGIGDVTGHGLESGILMLMVQTSVRTLQEMREVDPVRFLDVLNRTLYKNVQRMNSEKSLTLAILNYFEGQVSISGQHEEAIVVRKDGRVERIDTIDLGFPIALEDDIAKFISYQLVKLELGDGLVLYTDGIPEACDLNNKQYGMEKLCKVINENWQLSAQEIEQAIIADLQRHIGKQKVFDDITLLVLKRIEVKDVPPECFY